MEREGGKGEGARCCGEPSDGSRGCLFTRRGETKKTDRRYRTAAALGSALGPIRVKPEGKGADCGTDKKFANFCNLARPGVPAPSRPLVAAMS